MLKMGNEPTDEERMVLQQNLQRLLLFDCIWVLFSGDRGSIL